MKTLIYTAILFTLTFGTAKIPTMPNLPMNLNPGKDIPNSLIDLLYLNILTQSFYSNKNDFNYEYKILLTQSKSSEINSFSTKWCELVDGRDYSSSVLWQEGFSNQLYYLLNNDWNIYKILDHLDDGQVNNKLYIFKRITKK